MFVCVVWQVLGLCVCIVWQVVVLGVHCNVSSDCGTL